MVKCQHNMRTSRFLFFFCKIFASWLPVRVGRETTKQRPLKRVRPPRSGVTDGAFRRIGQDIGLNGNVLVGNHQPRRLSILQSGVAQLVGFWFTEAERSFMEAAKTDPRGVV